MSPENEYLAQKRADFLKRTAVPMGVKWENCTMLFDGQRWRGWAEGEIDDTPPSVLNYISWLEQQIGETRRVLLKVGERFLEERIKNGRDDSTKGSIYATEEHLEHG